MKRDAIGELSVPQFDDACRDRELAGLELQHRLE